MIENYTLMNKNTPVLNFEFDDDLNVLLKINEIYNLDFAPLIVKNAENILANLNNWFSDRGIPVYRDNAKELLDILKIKNTKELINKDYALSLSDQYWFKKDNEEITWDEINYFDKSYDSMNFADATYGNGAGEFLNQKNISNRTPNNTSSGQLKKVWIKKDGENFLYKGAGTIHNFEPINEVLASRICDILEVPHIKYELGIIQSKRQDTLVSICECAINKNEEIIHAAEILSERQNDIKGNINDYEIYLEILKSHNVPMAEEYLQKMFMLDYIILNEDRHLNNFGVIRDVQTLEWTRICPIFDTGRSMNTNVTTSYWSFEDGDVKCFTAELMSCQYLEQLFTKRITHEQINKLKDLQSEFVEMLVKYKEYTKLSDNEIKMLSNGYTRRVEIFEELLQEKELLV